MTKNKYWAIIIILLVVIIITGSLIVWSKYSPSQPVEISLPPQPELPRQIYIGGAVNNPGFYSLNGNDSLGNIIQAAGGTSNSADLSQLRLYVPKLDEADSPQKIDINRAEVWLLEALPGIGETRAKAIIDYRCQNGPFQNTTELTKVNGISITIYEQIKSLVTIAD